MAIAWIAFRKMDKVRDWWDEYRSNCRDWRISRYPDPVTGVHRTGWILETRKRATLASLYMSVFIDADEWNELVASPREAARALWDALRDEYLAASGIDPETGRRVAIPALDWHELKPVQAHGEVDELRHHQLGTGFRDVLLAAADLQRCWPPQKQIYDDLPPTVPPSGSGYMPLYCAAQWIATKGGDVHFDPEGLEHWKPAYGALLEAIASDRVAVVGTSRTGEREIVPGYHFADCEVDHPYVGAPLELLLGDAVYLQSYVYLDDQHWRNGMDDRLLSRQGVRWSRLMVRKEDVRSRWQFELPAPDAAGTPGRPTSKHLLVGELQRRASAHEMSESIVKESKYLSQWLADNHADMPQAKPKSIEASIRSLFYELRGRK